MFSVDFFMLGRWLWLLGFVTASGGLIWWMLMNKPRYLYGVSGLLWAVHGVLYYTAYLLAWYHPALQFDLQVFSNWGSVMMGQGAWTLAFISMDLATGWFSKALLPRWIHLPVLRGLI